MRIMGFLAAAAVALILVTSGCAPRPAIFIHQSVDFSTIKRVAVLPLNNLTREQFAADRIREMIITELLATGYLDVVEPGQTDKVIPRPRGQSPVALTPQEIKKFGKILNVQAFITGAVEAFGEVRFGQISAPEVCLTLHMVDVESGTIIWSVTNARGGVSFYTRLFGLGGDTMSESARKTVRKAIDTLIR